MTILWSWGEKHPKHSPVAGLALVQNQAALLSGILYYAGHFHSRVSFWSIPFSCA